MNSNILVSLFKMIAKILVITIIFIVVIEINTVFVSQTKTIGIDGEVISEDISENLIASIKVKTISSDKTVNVPILLYSNFDDNIKKVNSTTITPKKFETHLDMIENLGFNTISFHELIDFVENDIPIKENPIIITFDDGYYSNYKYLQKALEKKNMKATINLIVNYIDNKQSTDKKNESYLSWENLRKLKSGKLIEFAGHTYNMHLYNPQERVGVRQKDGESNKAYLDSLREDFSLMLELLKKETATDITVLAYPYGYNTEESEKICDDLSIKVTTTMEEGANLMTKDSSLRLLNRYTIPGYISDEEMRNLLNIFLLEQEGL